MRKAFLLGGLVLLCTATAFAGQRTRAGAIRGGDSDSSDSVFSSAREVAPGVAAVDIHGATLTMDANGAIELEAVIDEHGSVPAYLVTVLTSQIASAPGPTGDLVYASGIALNTREQNPTAPLSTVDQHMQDMLSATQTINGVDVFVFADGAMHVGTENNAPVNRTGIPSSTMGGVKVWADGVVENQ